jgi:Uma2 family endonuclease
MSQPYGWSVEQYNRLAELGVFDDERVELLDGEIWRLGRQSPPHAAIVSKARQVLQDTFGSGLVFSPKMPVTLSDTSEPEPDFSVAVGVVNNYADHHPMPSEILLVVEVADDMIEKDRGIKREIYARAGIVEYWLVNLVDRQLEVYRQPSSTGIYADLQVYLPGQSVAPLSAPDKPIAVSDLLPPMRQL